MNLARKIIMLKTKLFIKLICFYILTTNIFTYGNQTLRDSTTIVLQPGESIQITSPTFEKTWLSRGNIISITDEGTFLHIRGKKQGKVLLSVGQKSFIIYVVSTKIKKDITLIKKFLSDRIGLTWALINDNHHKHTSNKINPNTNHLIRKNPDFKININGDLLRLKDFKDLVHLAKKHQISYLFSAKVPLSLRSHLTQYIQEQFINWHFDLKNNNSSINSHHQRPQLNFLWNVKPLQLLFPKDHPYIKLYQNRMLQYGIFVKADSTLLTRLPLVELKILLVETSTHRSIQNIFSWKNNPESVDKKTKQLSIENSPSNFISHLLYQSFQKWVTFFKSMESQGQAQILTEALLLNEHNQTARLHSGGKVAIPHYHPTTGAESIQWKPYGIQLSFKTQTGRKQNIHIQAQMNISEVDHTYSTRQAPSLKSSSLSSSFTLQSGQSLALSTLIRHQVGESWLAPWLIFRLPFAGKFLSSVGKIKEKTRLNIIISARKI